MTQQNQQNPGQQVLWVLLRVSQANLSKIQPGKIKAVEGRDGKALPADLERFILLAELTGRGWKRGKVDNTLLWISLM